MNVFAAADRWRRPVLLVALVCAVPLALTDVRFWPLRLAVFLAFLTLLTLGVVAVVRFWPATLVRRPRAVATVSNPGVVLTTAGITILILGRVADDVADARTATDSRVLNTVTAVLLTLALVLQWLVAWNRFEVRLRPDGLIQRTPIGTLFVPWEAFARDVPAAPVSRSVVALSFEQPALVRKTGLRPAGNRLASGTSAAYLAHAIHHYVTHPGHRQAIGTEEEFHRLTAALTP